jgi:hypothetical protein
MPWRSKRRLRSASSVMSWMRARMSTPLRTDSRAARSISSALGCGPAAAGSKAGSL